MGRKSNIYKNNYSFLDSAILNDMTFLDFQQRLRRIALARFKWKLPNSMDSIYLEKTLYEYGQATLLKTDKFGFINTKCSNNGYINIYGLPTRLNCYSYDFHTTRKLYTGLTTNDEEEIKKLEFNDCILVRNDWDMIPTDFAIGLFAYRLYESERTSDVNVKTNKFPLVLTIDEKQRLFAENLISQYDGNKPLIIGDKSQMGDKFLKAITTDVPFICDKIQDYKDRIWNEALTYLGINNIMLDKKERLIKDEANSNNELINLNLQSFLEPRKKACEQFNEKFGLTGTDKAIDVQVNSDLHNIIKNEMSSIQSKKEGE